MTTYNRPGVYVNELPLAAAPINGALAATAAGAVIGAFPQGPDNVTLVTSWYDFVKKFGGYSKSYPATFAVGSFFKNGGTELYVKRILPAAAKKVAKVTIPSAPISASATVSKVSLTSNVATITTSAPHGITASDQVVTIAGLTSGNTVFNGTWTISGHTTTTVSFALTHTNITEANVTGTMTYSYSQNPTYATFAAKHRGLDGNNIRIQIAQSKAIRETGYYDVTVLYEAGVPDTVVGNVVTANAGDDTIVEQFNGVVFNDPLSGDYIVSVLEFGSAYVRVLEGAVVEYQNDGSLVSPEVTYTVGGVGTPTVDTVFPLSGAPSPENALTYGDYTGNFYVAGPPATGYDPATPSGTFNVDDCVVFTEFETIDKPLVFFLPDVTAKIADTPTATTLSGWTRAKDVYNALIEWVEAPKTNGRHFVVVETDGGLSVDGAISVSGDLTETSRAAVYYPHVYIKDPVGRSGASVRRIGPSGSVAGLFLNTDRLVGPFKAAAGIDTKIVDAIALERAFSSADLDALNTGVTTTGIISGKNVVNAIRNVPGAGVVVMGGRTLKQDGTANRYVNMRRSLTYLEKRLNDLASFAVFENNTETLWARLITVVGAFLNEYRNQGGLRGSTVAESFYVKCDAENNTPTTIAAGEVHVEVGVALEYPAEFVVINLSQKTV
jgi:hypothetical protein